MGKFVTGFLAPAALSAGLVGLAAPGAAAPSGGSAEEVISQLESQGKRVVVHREGGVPLEDAEVTSVRHGADVRQVVPTATSNRDSSRSVSGQTVHVTVG